MSFIKISLYSSLSTIISIVLRFATNKVAAVYLGANGMFLLGQLRDFLKITSASSNLGIKDGVIKYTAQYAQDQPKLNSYLSTGFKIHLLASIVVAVLTILFKDYIAETFLKNKAYSTFIILLAFSIITISLHSFILSVLNGLKQIKQHVIITIIASILSAIVMIYAVINYGIIGALYAFAIGQIIAFIVSFIGLAKNKNVKFSQFFNPFSKRYFKDLSQFSLMAFISPIFLICATLFVRNFILDTYDKQFAGSWEGMWRISAMYLLFITSTLQFYLLPTFSKLEGPNLRRELFKIWKITLPIILVIVAIIYALKDTVITAILSEEFLLIKTLIGFHLLGDIVRIMTWILGNLIKSKARTKVFIFLQFEWATAFILLTLLFVKLYGFVGVSIAYLGAYCIHFLCMLWFSRQLIWPKRFN